MTPALRAAWVWQRATAPGALVDWAKPKGVRELFVAVRADVATPDRNSDRGYDLRSVRELVRLARAEGIAVSALGGDPAWIDRPEAASSWTHAVVRSGLFDGVHVDVEPWARRDWRQRRTELVAGYLEVLQRVATLSPLDVEVDVAFWLHEVPTATGEPLDDAVARLADGLTALSYRIRSTGPDSIVDVSAAIRATARRHHLRCRLAVQTRAMSEDPDARKQTFHGHPPAVLERAMADVDTALSGDPAYAGIAVHDIDGWRAMGQGPPSS